MTRAESLFQKIKHGDRKHQNWLKKELVKWFADPNNYRMNEDEWIRARAEMRFGLEALFWQNFGLEEYPPQLTDWILDEIIRPRMVATATDGNGNPCPTKS